MSVRTLVIGGGGFIGREVVNALLIGGREVAVAGRRNRSLVDIPKGTHYITVDPEDPQLLVNLFPKFDQIIDLAYATAPNTQFSHPLADIQNNVFTSVHFFESLAKSKWQGRLVVVSSGGTVYGVSSHLPISESNSTLPISPYGIAKLVIERYAEMYYRLYGLNVVVVRPANAYGVGQIPFTGQGFVSTAIGCIAQRRPVTVFGVSGTVRDYVHVNDVATGILAALDRGSAGGFYNIGTGIGRTNMEVLDGLASLVTQYGFVVEVKNEPTRVFDVPFNVLNSSKLMDECGWQPALKFEDGLKEMWHDISLIYVG